MEARRLYDMQKDSASKLHYPTYTDIRIGDPCWYWQRDPNKIRSGKWVCARMISEDNDRSHVQIRVTDSGQEFSCTRTKMRLCHDPRHDITIPDESDEEHVHVECGRSNVESSRDGQQIPIDPEGAGEAPSGSEPTTEIRDGGDADVTVIHAPPGLDDQHDPCSSLCFPGEQLSRETPSFSWIPFEKRCS